MREAIGQDGAPRDLVVEYLVRGRSPWGTRLRAGGSAEEYDAATGWQPLVDLPAAEVAAFLRYAAESGYLDLPAALEVEGSRDVVEISWEIELEGRRHRVVAREPSHARNPVLVALDAELQRLVGEALNRAADAADDAEPGDDAAGGGDSA
jgi:hypothetical protein